MGFNNGYDAGWQDAINAVKYGKVPGLGPASGDGEAHAAPVHLTNTADRYCVIQENTARVRYAAPEAVSAVYANGTLDFQVSSGLPAGTVMNINLSFQYDGSEGGDWGADHADSLGISAITVNGASVSGLTFDVDVAEMAEGYRNMILWFDGTAWTCIYCEEDMP